MTDVNFPQDFYLDDVGVWRLKKEKLAEMEKPRPQTNEEWLRSCSTERLAEWINKLSWQCFACGSRNVLKAKDPEIIIRCPFGKCIQKSGTWLKEKHE